MSKRSQTTGLPKTKRKASAEEEKARKSRAEREAEIQRWVLIGTGITVGVVILIIAAALIIDIFIEPNQVVAEVNGETITVAEFQDRVRLERALLNREINSYISFLRSIGQNPDEVAGQEPLRTWLSQVQVPEQLGNRVVNEMVDEMLIRQQAAERGITVTDDEIDEQINQFFGFDPETIGVEPTPTLTPTITPTPFVSPTPSPEPTHTPTTAAEATAEATAEVTAEATEDTGPTTTPFPTIPPTQTRTPEEEIENFEGLRDEFFAGLRADANVSQEFIQSYFETRALQDALRDNITEDITRDMLHVNARHILVATEEEAQDVLDALENGEAFSTLARAASTDTDSGQRGGELGWSPVMQFVDPFAEAVTDAELGVTVGPVESEFGFHIIQVHNREVREITEGQLDQFKESEFSTWLDNLREEQQDSWEIFPIWANHIPSNPPFVLTG